MEGLINAGIEVRDQASKEKGRRKRADDSNSLPIIIFDT